MTSPVLYYYIKNTLAAGKTKEDITTILQHEGGWNKEDLDRAFVDVMKGNVPNTVGGNASNYSQDRRAADMLAQTFGAILLLVVIVVGGYLYKISHDDVIITADAFSITLPTRYNHLTKLNLEDFLKIPNKSELGLAGGLNTGGCSKRTDSERILFSCVRKDSHKALVMFIGIIDKTLDPETLPLDTQAERKEFLNKIKVALQITQPADLTDVSYDDITNQGEPALIMTVRTKEKGAVVLNRTMHLVKEGKVIGFQFSGLEDTVTTLWPYVEQSIWASKKVEDVRK